jgi:membrane-bound metal-dependent hydrolase YbcI (DUF457 family)
MFFWFIGTAVITVGLVFRDPRFDYRLLIVGSVLPIGDGLLGGARMLHTLTLCVVLLAVLMIATRGRKPIRKMLLGLPIGMILHLVFDGAWNNTEVFWWPFFGWSFDDSPLPELDRGWWSVLLEVMGVALCVWLWRHNSLGDPARRAKFRHDGQLDAVPERLG